LISYEKILGVSKGHSSNSKQKSFFINKPFGNSKNDDNYDEDYDEDYNDDDENDYDDQEDDKDEEDEYYDDN